MYLEIILIVIFVLIIYFLYFHDTRIDYLAFDGNNYKIIDTHDTNKNKKKADMLARINDKAHKIVKHLKDSELPTKKISQMTYDRFKNCKIGEIPEKEGGGYTINKGTKMGVCLVTKGKFNDENDAYFVILHELAHVMSNSYGHGDEFKQNFDYIVKLAVKLDLWKPKNYSVDPVDYCGVKVTNSPCTGESCNKDNLDFYYKESLLSYK